MQNSKQSTAMLLFMGLMFGSSNVVFAENQDQLAPITVSGTAETKAQEGKDQVYLKDQVTEYKSKKEIEAYRGNSAGDLLAGFSGVYSGDVRNGGAIDPIIRSSWGQGRVPVIVDDSEQAVTIWRGFAGASNRNYLDPFLVSSVTVEKGSRLSRDLNSGPDGTVRMTTLEVDDIVKPGKKWGVEVKTETATNSAKKPKHPYTLHTDYRTLPNQGDFALGIYSLYYRKGDQFTQHSGNRNKLFNDNAFRIATAYKGDKFESLLAYAYRNKGNYYAGSHGDEKYGGDLTYADIQKMKETDDQARRQNNTSEDIYIPYIGAIYKKKKEVPNTSYNSKSFLAKTKFKFNDEIDLKLTYRHTKLKFGDIMPSRLYKTYEQLEENTVLQWPEADVKQNIFNTEFHYNPKDNQYINFTLGGYLVHNHSNTNTAGGSPGDILFRDRNYEDFIDSYITEIGHERLQILMDHVTDTADKHNPEYIAEMKKLNEAYKNSPNYNPNIDGIFNTQETQLQTSKDYHWGINVSNRFELNSKLNLDVMANYRRETLDSTNIYELWDNNIQYPNVFNTKFGGEYYSAGRKGKRNEFNAGFNFTYNPTDWLILTAGARYTHYKLRDTGLAEQIAKGKEFNYEVARYFDVEKTLTKEDIEKYTASAKQKQANNEELSAIENKVLSLNQNRQESLHPEQQPTREEQRITLKEEWDDNFFDEQDEYPNFEDYYNEWVFDYPKVEPKELPTTDYIIGQGDPTEGEETRIYWYPGKDGKYHLKNNPLFDGRITDEMLTEHQKHPFTEEVTPCTTQSDGSEYCPKQYEISYNPTFMYETKKYTAEELAELLKPKKDHAWSPSLGITALITDSARIYARYNETNRMPSIFEGTAGFSTNSVDLRQGIKPEKTQSFEIGYIQDLTGVFPSLRRADFRINYFHNTTHNIFDRIYSPSQGNIMYQFDKRTLEGLEVQGRYDQGNFFGDISLTYHIKNKMCDKDQALLDTDPREIDKYIQGKTDHIKLHPTCVNGGFGAGYLRSTVLPKYSIVGNLGFRALNEKLEMSTRLTYHTNVKDTYAKSMRDAGFGNPNVLITRWQPVFLVDAYINYQFNKDFSISLAGTNLTDRYYLDPYSKSAMPGPGRTIKLGLTAKF